MRSRGRGGKPLRGPRVRGDDRLRGDRLRAQAHGPPQFAFRVEALQRAARGDGHVPEFPAKTLKELEEVGIAERKVHLDRPVAVEYRLSPKGAGLFEAIRDLERWATRWVMNSVPREVTQ